MKVVNCKTGEWTFYDVQNPKEAICLAYEHHEKENYGIRFVERFDKYPIITEGYCIRCGEWECEKCVNPWNKSLYPNCKVEVHNWQWYGMIGRVTKSVESRIPYVEGVGYVPAEKLKVLDN